MSFNNFSDASDNTPAHQRRLVRSTSDKWVAGVLGGFAQTYNIDPTLLRVLFLGLTLFTGAPILIYLVAWVIMPTV